MKIALLTLPLSSRNYGGTIQCYALCSILKKFGHEVIVLDRRKDKAPFIWLILSHFKQWIYKHVLKIKGKYFDWNYVCQDLDRFITSNMVVTKPLYSTLELRKEFIRGNFDAIILGSDQIWRKPYVSSILDFWGVFIPANLKVKKIAYAASFGTEKWEYSEEETRTCRKLASLLSAISVREDNGIDLCKTHLQVNAVHLLDPAFLLERKSYYSLLEKKDRDLQQSSLSTYILDMTSEKASLINVVKNYLGVNDLLQFSIREYEEEGKRNGSFRYPSISTWLTVYEKSDFVVTDSYHGCVFAILFNKPFIVIANSERGIVRFESLLKMFHLYNHLVFSLADLQARLHDVMSPIDYTTVNKILIEKRQESIDFIKDSLGDEN